MGNCAKSKQSKYMPSGDQEPQDTQNFSTDNNLPKLKFQLKISNIKLKNINIVVNKDTAVSLVFNIQGITEFNLEKKHIQNGYIRWNLQHRKFFELNEYQLRKKFINIIIQDEQHRILGNLSLNLYLIATGPYHHDFQILNNSKTIIGRLSGDFKITQKIQMTIQTKNVIVKLNKDRRADSQFNYTIKTIINTSKVQDNQSQASYNKEVNKDNIEKRSSNLDDKRLSLTKKSSGTSKVINSDQMHLITWNQQEANLIKKILPFIKTEAMVSDLNNGSFQFLLWMLENNNNRKSTQNLKDIKQEQQDSHLCAQCYVSFNKIYQREFQKIQINNIVHEMRQLQITQKIWNHGKLIGQVVMKLKVITPKFFKQMIVFVRTQNKIQKSSPIAIYKQDSKSPECRQILELIKIKQEIDVQSQKITKLMQNTSNENQIKRVKVVIRDTLSKIESLLLFTVKQSSFLYSYSSQQQLMKSQFIILQIGFKLLQYLQEQQTFLDDICWINMIALMKRGQLNLRCMGFRGQEDITNIRKIQLSIRYQTFLYRVLKIVLNCLNKKALQQNQRHFVQLFCAYSYFRIPQFRKIILKTIIKQNDPQIDQWRGTSFKLNDEAAQLAKKNSGNTSLQNGGIGSDTFSILFDWQLNFYRHISSDQRSKQNYIDLNQVLSKQQWKHRMQKRGVAFFFFIIYWIKYVQEIAIKSQNVQWHYLPGYLQLLKAVLCQMKIRSIIQYPDSLKEVTVKLLGNQKLLNVFVAILFKKTDKFDSVCVLKTIQLLDSYIKTLVLSKKNIPTTFNYIFFFSGIKQILLSDHSYAIAKCLLLLYNHFYIFSWQFRRQVSMFLLGKLFFRLFLNWSRNVRLIFQHLIVFRIYLQSNILLQKSNQSGQVKTQYTLNQQTKKRYLSLINILQNAKDLKQRKQGLQIAQNFEKQYYKKMKKKLYDKRRQLKIRQKQQNKNSQMPLKKQKKKDDEFSIKQLIRKQPQRIQSEATNIKISYPTLNLNDQRFDTNSKMNNGDNDLKRKISQDIQISQFRVEEKRRRKMSNNVQDYQIQQLKLDQLQYINDALIQYSQIEQIYQQHYGKATQKDPVPQVQIKIPIDQGQMGPEGLNQW